jgi:hypothetical protein
MPDFFQRETAVQDACRKAGAEKVLPAKGFF